MLSGKEQAIKITPSTGLTKEEIDLMVQQAKEFAQNDRQESERTELRNRISAQAAVLGRSYSGFGSYLDGAEQVMIKNAIRKAKELSPDESNIGMLRDGAASLAKAMFNAPEGEGLGKDEWPEHKRSEADINQLMKSALDDASNS
jgi:molecular chaperone DnaK